MENNLELLKYIYQEDLYIIDEPARVQDQDTRVEQQQIDAPAKAEEQMPVQFFGRNAKGILILVEDPENELLNQAELDFLMKVVESGLRYSKNDFALVNTARFPVSQILDEVPSSHILSFGVRLPKIDVGASTYQVMDLDGNQVLLAHPLREIAQDQNKKKSLWSSLKSMFNIS